MPAEPASDLKFEIGHVLFIDIVGCSKLVSLRQRRNTTSDSRSFPLLQSTPSAKFAENSALKPERLLHRVEAAQCLQSGDCLRGRRAAGDADSRAGFSISRNSELGDPAGLHRRTD